MTLTERISIRLPDCQYSGECTPDRLLLADFSIMYDAQVSCMRDSHCESKD